MNLRIRWPLTLKVRVYCCLGDDAFGPQRQTPRDRRSHKESPRGSLLGGIPLGDRACRCGRRASLSPLDVVATALEIGEQRLEHGSVHNVSAVVRAGAVPDRDHLTEIGCDLHAAAV